MIITLPEISFSPTLIYLGILTFVYWLTWTYSIKGDWISDDWEGIQKFLDRWDSVKEEVIDYFEHETEKNGKKEKVKVRHRSFNRYIEFPGSLIRWIRLNLGAKHQVIGKNKKGHDVWGHVQSAKKHHLISLVIHFFNIILTYFLLSNVLTQEQAFIATLLFAVHPISTQCVAWISGIGYLLSLFFTLLALQTPFWISEPLIHVPITVLFTLLASSCLLSGMANFVILAFLGFWWASLACLLVTIGCFLTQGLWVLRYRVGEFKKQNMIEPTKITWRRPIIMLKSFYYYVKMLIFPKRLALYHIWGYHFDEKLSKWDWMSTKGLLILIGLGAIFYFAPTPVKFGLIWMIAYLVLFLNLVTAQQTVVDRYAFISSLGYSVIFAWTFSHWPILCAFLIGLYLMRTWAHLPTYDNEIKFYQSNLWNFNSEVALGNLGVVYKRVGLDGMAVDSWKMATQVNDSYDVPHYNLYSIMKFAGALDQARYHLEKALNAKVCHFDKLWKEELSQLNNSIYLTQSSVSHINRIRKAMEEVRR